MARSVNKVILIGNLGKDPEVRYMPDGRAVASATLATTESWTDKQSNEKQERTEWHNLTFFGRLAEIAGEYLKKGARTYVEGSIRTDKWQDKEGKDRYTTKIVVNEMMMLDGRANSGGSDFAATGGGSGGQSRPSSAPRGPAPSDRQGVPRDAQAPSGPAPAGEDFDDDIPF